MENNNLKLLVIDLRKILTDLSFNLIGEQVFRRFGDDSPLSESLESIPVTKTSQKTRISQL